MSVVIGWDVGSAHLEAARAEGGRIVAAIQIASPLWLGVSRLDEAFRTGRSELGSADAHAVTMTGELSMAFTSRSEGVAALAALTAVRLGAGAVTSLCRARGLPLPRRRGRPCERRRLGQLACERGADRTLLPGSAAHRHGVDDDRHHSPSSGRAATPTRNGWRPGARLRRPRAELGIRERKPCALPPEDSSHLASRHPLGLSIIRRSDYFRKGGVGESRPREHVAV